MLYPSVVALGFAVLVGIASAGLSLADSRVPFALEVESVTGKVGEPTAVRATITPPEGVKLESDYRHRIIDLSAYEDRGVAFDDEVVIGRLEDGKLLFEIGVTPTEAGKHPINGVMRVGFAYGNKTESKSIPLMATVTGTE